MSEDIDRYALTGALRRSAVKKHVAAIHVSGKLTLLQRKSVERSFAQCL